MRCCRYNFVCNHECYYYYYYYYCSVVDDIFENKLNKTDAKFYSIELVSKKSSERDIHVKVDMKMWSWKNLFMKKSCFAAVSLWSNFFKCCNYLKRWPRNLEAVSYNRIIEIQFTRNWQETKTMDGAFIPLCLLLSLWSKVSLSVCVYISEV